MYLYFEIKYAMIRPALKSEVFGVDFNFHEIAFADDAMDTPPTQQGKGDIIHIGGVKS